MRHLRNLVVEAWLPVVLVVGWWLVSASSTSLFFPPLSRILTRFRQLWFFERIPTDVAPSLRNYVVGLLIGAALGIAVGAVLGFVPWLWRALRPLFELLRATPVIALFPLAIILLGTGDGEKVTLIGFACFWPVLLATVDGVRGVDPAKLDVSHSFRLGRAMTLWRVVLPAAAPQVAGGIRTATSVGLVTMLGSELYAADRGIGYFVLQSQREFSIVDMWAGLLLLGMLGYLVNLLVGIAEHRLLSWHRSMREFESRRLHA